MKERKLNNFEEEQRLVNNNGNEIKCKMKMVILNIKEIGERSIMKERDPQNLKEEEGKRK